MKKVEASKLNRSLKEVLESVAKGNKVELTRYGKVVAKIVPPGARDPKQPEKDPGPIFEPAEGPDDDQGPSPSVEQIRQRRRDFLLNRINKAPKP